MTWWDRFTGSFETKGAQILLLWFTDILVLLLLVVFWKYIDGTLQTTIVGVLTGINGAFLGATGSRPSNGNSGGSSSTPTQLAAFVTPKKEG